MAKTKGKTTEKKTLKKSSPAKSQQQIRKEATKKRAFKILNMIEEGASLRKSLKDNKMSSATFFKIVDEDEFFEKQYVRACQLRAELMLDDMINIADDNTQDTIRVFDKNGNEIDVEDKEWTNRSKLRVDVRKWAMSKMHPKKFGDKMEIDSKVEQNVNVNWKSEKDEQ